MFDAGAHRRRRRRHSASRSRRRDAEERYESTFRASAFISVLFIDIANVGCLLDPRLSRDRLTTDQLVGTVEKTLSILGYGGEKRPALITPAKRKVLDKPSI